MKISNQGIITHLGLDLFIFGFNQTGATITRGSAVALSGAGGTVPLFIKAIASSSAAMPAAGLALTDIPDSTYGQLLNVGFLNNIDTSGFLVGDVLYVSPASAGGLTKVAPTNPNFQQRIGIVTVADVSVGIVAVQVQPAIPISFVGSFSGSVIASGTLTGTLTGSVTGGFTGLATGTFTGSVTGGFTGLATGTFTGSVTGAIAWGNVFGNLVAASSSFTASAGDTTQVYTGGGQVVALLPNAASASARMLLIKKTSRDGNYLIVSGAAGALIDGSVALQIQGQYTAITLLSDGTNWNIV